MFPAGETSSSFSVVLNDDDILEANEDFILVVNMSSLPDDVTVGIPSQVVVTIVDDDGKHNKVDLLQFKFSNTTCDELLTESGYKSIHCFKLHNALKI